MRMSLALHPDAITSSAFSTVIQPWIDDVSQKIEKMNLRKTSHDLFIPRQTLREPSDRNILTVSALSVKLLP